LRFLSILLTDLNRSRTWLVTGTGNANFYYNQTLIYNTFSSLMILEFTSSMVKRVKDFRTAAAVS
jgi:hypothetical protein